MDDLTRFTWIDDASDTSADRLEGNTLDSPWWVQVAEIGIGSTLEDMLRNIPKTRRGHAACMFRVTPDMSQGKQERELEL
jgi:hypothetical protein